VGVVAENKKQQAFVPVTLRPSDDFPEKLHGFIDEQQRFKAVKLRLWSKTGGQGSTSYSKS
jgi:hypothetical protein